MFALVKTLFLFRDWGEIIYESIIWSHQEIYILKVYTTVKKIDAVLFIKIVLIMNIFINISVCPWSMIEVFPTWELPRKATLEPTQAYCSTA